MAFSLTSLFTKKPSAAQAERDSMPATQTAQGAVVGSRPLQNPAWGGGYTPDAVAGILERAERGDETAITEYFALADKVIEREMHTAGVVNGLVLAIAGLQHKAVAPKSTANKRAQKIADEVTALMQPSSPLRLAAPGILSQGITHGIGAAAVLYTTSATSWTPSDFVQKPAHHFTFSREDGRTPLLRNATAGQPAEPLEPGLSLVFTPRRNSAMQVKNGLAWILCWAYVVKSLVLADEMLFIQTFGHPLVFAKYPRNASPDDMSMLQRAVSSINSTFRAVYRDDLQIDFKEIARSNTDIYEKVCRYFDELISKVVWASTLTTDAGGGGKGSFALGKVHAEGKYDVIRTYAYQWSATLQELVNAYVVWNYGPDAPIPQVVVDIEEAEDLVAKSTIVKNLHDAGVPLVASEVRETFGFREPQAGDELIGASIAQPSYAAPAQGAPGAAQNARQGVGCPVHSAQAQAPVRDALDDLADGMLADWESVTAGLTADLADAARTSHSADEMRDVLLAALDKLDYQALTEMLTKARTKARLAGNSGAEV
jgi:phage gp29-like protein